MADANAKIDISRILNNTIGVIGRHPFIYLGLSLLIVGIPNALLETMQGGPMTDSGNFGFSASYSAQGFGFIALMVLSIIAQATLIVATINDLGGKPVSMGECFSKAVNKFLPLLGLGIIVAIGVGLGFLLLIVPGVILILMWFVATPVMMAEDKGVFDSLSRSAELTSGSKGTLFILAIIFFVIAMIIGVLLTMFGSMGTVVLGLFTMLTNTITGALQGAGVASAYVELRAVKEGTDTETLADVFA
ncbi:hypothetical protein [Parasphingorhabdus sp.]|uniref:DUF7544 domain-containing protein n=1 Tax=Parasphingorhabdus sp. TaxID=2709688 RepID=UPI00326664DC